MTGEKTEAATPKKLDDARREGDVARSRDLVAFAALAATAMAASPALREVFGVLVRTLRAAFARVASATSPLEDAQFFLAACGDALRSLAPLLATAVGVALVVGRLDAGPVFALAKVAPSLDKLDPAKGLASMVSRDRLAEVGKAVVAMGAVVGVASFTLASALPSLARLPSADVGVSLTAGAALLDTLVSRALPVFAILAAYDVVRSRRAHARRHRMSKDEVRREHKESDGDPHLRGERQRMHREILEHAALESVRRATVLVVNPTHLAVALHFDVDSEQEAPEVLAKGEDHLALRMIEAAREAGVPVLRDIPLARGLYGLELGDAIPEALFDAVAAVLRAAEDERRAGP